MRDPDDLMLPQGDIRSFRSEGLSMSRGRPVRMFWLLLIFLSGCASGPAELPSRRGVVVPTSEVPDTVLREFHRRDPGKVRGIEKIESGALFRFETEAGSVIYIDQAGIWKGTVI